MPQPLRIALILFVALGVLGLAITAFARAFRRSEDPVRLAVKWIVTILIAGALFWLGKSVLKNTGSFAEGAIRAAIVVFSCLAAGIVLTIMWGGSIGQIIASPFTSMFDGGGEELEPQPLYSIAESLRRRGKFREAIYAIQEQLEKFPADFTGQMMLAEIQAENLNELDAAEITIHRICEQKQPAPSLAFALNSLADWHLKYRQDPEAAKSALEKIMALLPDSEFGRSAAQRIAHLADPDMLVKLRDPDAIAMKRGVEYLGLLKDQSHLLPKQVDAADQAEQLVAHLAAHPLDHEARERLAVIYAQNYGRLDLAAEQLEYLIALPDESPKHVARWLNLLADLQVQTTNTTELAGQTLRRIIERFPGHSAAQLAEDRLALLKLELKRYEQGPTVKFPATETRRS